MKHNMGNIDRALRTFVVAPAAIVAAALVGIGSIGGVILIAVAAVMLATSAVGYCPLYALLGVNTCPRKPALHG